ncbi:MAG: phasin family protein [Hyphomicrobium sp.]
MDQLFLGPFATGGAGLSSATASAKTDAAVVAGLSEYSGALCDGCTAMSAEWLSFINRRLHADMSLPVRMARCGSPQDLMQAWSDFMLHAAADYQTEFQRLGAMSARISHDAAATLRPADQPTRPSGLRAA